MPETLTRTSPRTPVGPHPLQAGWCEGLSLINLRGDAGDPAFVAAVSAVLGLTVPVRACTTEANAVHRMVWAGPDDWFVVGPPGQAAALVARLQAALAGLHVAVTDVSSGYTVLRLGGAPVRDVLAQGCPLDLHPRVFGPGMAAGSHFFKASVWLWPVEGARADDAPPAGPVLELLVRRSVMDYVWLMLARCTQECGLLTVTHRPA